MLFQGTKRQHRIQLTLATNPGLKLGPTYNIHRRRTTVHTYRAHERGGGTQENASRTNSPPPEFTSRRTSDWETGSLLNQEIKSGS